MDSCLKQRGPRIFRSVLAAGLGAGLLVGIGGCFHHDHDDDDHDHARRAEYRDNSYRDHEHHDADRDHERREYHEHD